MIYPDVRYITVYKKEKSTIVAKDALLELSDESRRLVNHLLGRSPVSVRDKVSLSANLETRLTRPSLGRLGGGVAQVPGPPGSLSPSGPTGQPSCQPSVPARWSW